MFNYVCQARFVSSHYLFFGATMPDQVYKPTEGITSTDPVYKSIEVTGTSSLSIDNAIRSAVKKAAETVRNMRWFEVVETRGRIEDDQVARFQTTIKIGFELEE
jgi:flavin-binding protein dodecin